MWDLVHKTIIWSQKVRTVLLSSIIQKSGVTATQLTIASFITGITSVFFFDTVWFIVFGILHLVFDACDGIAARTEGTTERGKYMDWLSDQTAALFLMVTITQLMPTQLNKIIVMLYGTYTMMYGLSSMKIPPMSARTLLFLCSFTGIYQLGMYIVFIIALYGYITAYHHTFFSPRTNAR